MSPAIREATLTNATTWPTVAGADEQLTLRVDRPIRDITAAADALDGMCRLGFVVVFVSFSEAAVAQGGFKSTFSELCDVRAARHPAPGASPVMDSVRHEQVLAGPDGIEVDRRMAPLLEHLWGRGYRTRYSCQDKYHDGSTAHIVFDDEASAMMFAAQVDGSGLGGAKRESGWERVSCEFPASYLTGPWQLGAVAR